MGIDVLSVIILYHLVYHLGKGFGGMSKRIFPLALMWLIPFLVMVLMVKPAMARPLELIGSYSTPLLDKSPNRMTNVKLAVEKINGYELKPQQVFSFNQVVGPRTKERGFKEAIVFEGGKMVKDVGGGICQVSSTLYQAALSAGLKVTESHRHSLPVRYIAQGKDATVVYGIKDLKFVNNTPDKLLIESLLTDNKVLVRIYKILGKPVKVYLDGQVLEATTQPYAAEGTVYVPLRILAEKMGFAVEWVGGKQQIILRKGNVQLAITIGSPMVYLNGQPVKAGAAPKVINDTTVVPVRFVAEAFGSNVQWNEKEQAVYITSPKPASQASPIESNEKEGDNWKDKGLDVPQDLPLEDHSSSAGEIY